jgi:hypothetical protein
VLDNEYNYFGFKSKERKITGKGRSTEPKLDKHDSILVPCVGY